MKHLLSLWLVLFLVVGTLFYNAYRKLKPEVFISLLSEQVQRNYPGTRLEVGKVDYRLSVDFNMGLKNIMLKRNGEIIGSLEEIEIRLPWWLLLFERGNAQINLQNLNIYLDEDKADVSAPVSSNQKKATKSSSQIQIDVPDYLANAQFTLRAKDVTIKDLKNSRRYFTLSKLLVRQFQFGKNSAFEVNIPIEISHNQINFKSELWLFGDLTPTKNFWDLKFRGEFRATDVNEKLQLEDLVIDGKARINPQQLDATSELAFFIEKKQVGTGSFMANDNSLQVSLKLSEFPMSFLALFEEEIKNPYLPLLLERAVGLIDIKKNYKEEIIKTDGFLEFPGQFPLGSTPDSQVSGKWRLNFSGSKWETSFMSPAGEISYFRRAVINFKKRMIAQYVDELGFVDVDFGKAVQLVYPLEKILDGNEGTYASSSVSFKRCKYGERIIDGIFRYGKSPDQKFYTADLKDNESFLKLNFQQTGVQRKIDLVAAKFAWSEHYRFIGKYFEANSGILDGKVEGRWSTDWLNGQWLLNLKVSDLNSAKGELFSLLEKVWSNFNLDPKSIPEQQWNFSLKDENINIDSLLLDGVDPAKLTGQLDLRQKKKSFLTLAYPKNKKWKPVKKDITEPLVVRTAND